MWPQSILLILFRFFYVLASKKCYCFHYERTLCLLFQKRSCALNQVSYMYIYIYIYIYLFYFHIISKILIHITCLRCCFFSGRKLRYFPDINILLDRETLDNYRVINTKSKSSCYIKGGVAMVNKMWVSLIVQFTPFSWNCADESMFYNCLLFLQLI